MHLFTSTRQFDTLQGPSVLTLAADVAHLASTITGLEVIPWTGVFGLPPGTVVYSARVDSQAAAVDGLAAVAADPGYQRLVARSERRLHAGPAEHAVAELVSSAGSNEPTGDFASVAVVQCAPGRTAEATAWGVDALSHASKTTGLDGSFLRCVYGPWATLVWMSLAGTMEEVDLAAAALAADATYVERIDDAGPLFLPGSGSQRLLRRLV